MMKQIWFVLLAITVEAAQVPNEEQKAKAFIDDVDKKSLKLAQEYTVKQWAADTADNANSKKTQDAVDEVNKKWDVYQRDVYGKVMSFPWKTFKDQNLKRMFYINSLLQDAALPDDKRAKMEKVQAEMYKLIDTALVKEYHSANSVPKLKAADVDEIITKDYMNFDEMNFYWKELRDTVGKPVKSLFTQYVAFVNETAHLNKYNDAAQYMQAIYEVDNFENTMLQLYKKIEPLYKELHAYIRYHLWVAYGKNDKIVNPKGPIPASLFDRQGLWSLLTYPLLYMQVPWHLNPTLDISSTLKAKGYTGRKSAETAEKFLVSLGLDKLPAKFWSNSIFEKKGDMKCLPDTYNFYNGDDFRLIFCAEPAEDDFTTMHGFIAKIEYFMAFKKLPYSFQDMPNSAFDDAFTNLISDFATSTPYLQSLGLIDPKIQLTKERKINSLHYEAMKHLLFLPYAYSYELWRWRVLQGKITPEHYNCEYWKIRSQFQGVEPPVDRSENDFDIGDNPWFLAGGQYIPGYIGKFLKYDMFRGLCRTTGFYDPKTKPNNPLIFCDISNNKDVGKKLKEMMSLGDSRPWYDALEKVTGHKTLDASGLLEFFQPFYQWLKEENKKNNVTAGWTSDNKRCH